jgi:hypothetical protein
MIGAGRGRHNRFLRVRVIGTQIAFADKQIPNARQSAGIHRPGKL